MFRELLKSDWIVLRGSEIAMLLILAVFLGVVIYLLVKPRKQVEEVVTRAMSDGEVLTPAQDKTGSNKTEQP